MARVICIKQMTFSDRCGIFMYRRLMKCLWESKGWEGSRYTAAIYVRLKRIRIFLRS